MAILDRFKKKGAERHAKSVTSEKKAPVEKATGKGSPLSHALLRMPQVSEKAARLADKGTYVFRVPMHAEKVAVKKAVESLYGVSVAKVRMITTPGKPVRRGRRVSHRQDIKKALVTLKKGQTIAVYEGV